MKCISEVKYGTESKRREAPVVGGTGGGETCVIGRDGLAPYGKLRWRDAGGVGRG